MKTTRHRFIVPRKEPVFTNEYLWDVGNQLWVPHDENLYLGVGPNPPTYESRMMDVLGDDHETMHDCVHHHSSVFYTNGLSGADMRDYVDVCTGPQVTAKSMQMPGRWIYQATRQDSIPRLIPKFVDALFRRDALPGKIDLGKDYDPSQGFSIWMLLADLLQLPNLLVQLFKAPKVLYRSGLSIREMANTNLFLQFGVMATYSDFREFFRICAEWRSAYDSLRASQDAVYRWRQPAWTVPDELRLKGGVFSPLPVQGVSGVYSAKATILQNVVHCRTLKYRVTCPELTGWLARVCQFIDAFGVFNPLAAWDRIPWSFVIDWFIPLGNWLTRHTPKVYPLDIVIKDYCESIKYFRSVTYTCQHHPGFPIGGPGDDIAETQFAVKGEQIFIRRRFKPPEVIIDKPTLHSPVLSMRRIGIAASLVAQKLPRRLLR